MEGRSDIRGLNISRVVPEKKCTLVVSLGFSRRLKTKQLYTRVVHKVRSQGQPNPGTRVYHNDIHRICHKYYKLRFCVIGTMHFAVGYTIFFYDRVVPLRPFTSSVISSLGLLDLAVVGTMFPTQKLKILRRDECPTVSDRAIGVRLMIFHINEVRRFSETRAVWRLALSRRWKLHCSTFLFDGFKCFPLDYLGC